MTPPSTAGLDALVAKEDIDVERGDIWTPTRSPSTPVKDIQDQYFKASGVATRPSPHRRALSQSTIDEHTLPVRDSDAGAFRVVIDRPGTAPKAPEFPPGVPSLHVPIPSYKLGTPRFSMHGTAFLRSSSYTTTDDMRSSIMSSANPSEKSFCRSHNFHSRRHSDVSPHDKSLSSSPMNTTDESSGAVRRHSAIVPEMYDALTFKPSCNHPSVVRHSRNGGIKAATPARLVAEITSDTFVNYDLLSDFFLTFRSFLDPLDLLYMLVARLRWAVSRNDNTGTVVRVRTFVAIRHWILNYFSDDFVIDWGLRRHFCELINQFVEELLKNTPEAKVPLRILDELKRCWRRVCALYWDGPEFETELDLDLPIVCGGVAGSRDPKLDPTFWETLTQGPPQLEGIIEPDFVEREVIAREDRNYFADVSRAGHLDSVIIPSGPTDPERPIHTEYEPPLSPSSFMSEDFISCSFPSKMKDLGGAHQFAAHPVPASSVYDSSGPVATTPKALTGKRVHPTQAHKRSGSFSDSTRDHRGQQQPIQKVVYKNTDILMALPFAGSLVRGNLFPPGQAYVEVVAPSTPAEVGRAHIPSPPPHHRGPSAMSGPGMKKLLGSVRRALSTRTGAHLNASPTQGSFPHIPPLGVRGATINRLPGTAVVPQERPRNAAPMRIDLLGAEIAKDFKNAVQEDAEASTGSRQSSEQRSSRSTQRGPRIDYSIIGPETTVESRPSFSRTPASEMTNGSKSILIIDDTLPIDLPRMAGALPVSASDERIAIPMRPSIGPTPPTTPPEASLTDARTSSPVLGHSQSTSLDRTPSLIVDSRPSQDDGVSLNRSVSRPSTRPLRRSYKPKRSVSLRRYASYHSGVMRHMSEHSFDATTLPELDYGEQRLSSVSDISGVAAPSPLRVLRRRPGGDLRAVTNVGDLNTRPLRRPMSTSSITTYSDSLRSSYMVGDGQMDYDGRSDGGQDQNQQHFSLGALAEGPRQVRGSLHSNTSSEQVVRPSFEKEAQMLAQIPDDDDDGGVESALLKLEGKFEQRRSDGSGASLPCDLPMKTNSFGANPLDISTLSFGEDEEEKQRHRHEHIVETPPHISSYRPHSSPQLEGLKPAVYQPTGMQYTQSTLSETRNVDSHDPTTPLLDRVSLGDRKSRAKPRDWSQHSILLGHHRRRQEPAQNKHLSSASSFDFITHDSSKDPRPVRDSTSQSFLDSDSDGANRSDLSTEMSVELNTRVDNDHHTVSTHPLASNNDKTPPSHLRHPPSPPITLIQALSLSPDGTETTQLYPNQLPLSPDHVPVSPEVTPPATVAERAPTRRAAIPQLDPLRAHSVVEPSRKTSVHLPFIMAFDSQILAQQFTLIEKDALNELDWKDLIEMRWKDSDIDPRSWVDFLRSSEPRGVEVVIARFNIMVKWAVSEIILTEDLEERAACISKYIHIAANCRKYRNFATMTQLTVALTSKEISRLTKTWACVPCSDTQILRDMEALVTPMSNFFSLRAEMEGSGAGQGCIPFVGIYTHDLLVNFERPSQIASTPTTEPLINFEKYRSTSAIVKNLLRLVEASQLYRFLPIEGITERCLWMAALSDEDIGRYGKMIA